MMVVGHVCWRVKLVVVVIIVSIRSSSVWRSRGRRVGRGEQCCMQWVAYFHSWLPRGAVHPATAIGKQPISTFVDVRGECCIVWISSA
jgi:hypothetical protein